MDDGSQWNNGLRSSMTIQEKKVDLGDDVRFEFILDLQKKDLFCQ